MIRVVQAVVAALSAALLAHLWSGDSFTFMMGHFPAPWGNELRAGPLEALLALAFSLVMFLSLTGGAEDIRRDIREERQGQYCLLMQLLYAALLAMVYTNDLFTAYVFVEIAAVTACIAVVAKESGRSVVAAIRYLVFSCLGSGLILLGISMLYSVTGHLLMEDLGRAVAQLAQTGRYAIPLTASALLMTLGLAIKSAQFPFHAWLPDAHASATTASSAILSGLVLKGYIVLIIKLILRVFGSSVLIEMYLHDLLFLLGVAGMLFASVAALRQEEVKRMIAYSSSAQISYIFLALGLGSRAGTAAACFQLLTHAFTKPMIFVGAGALIRAGGEDITGVTCGVWPGGLQWPASGLPWAACLCAAYRCWPASHPNIVWLWRHWRESGRRCRLCSAWLSAPSSTPCIISPLFWSSGAGGTGKEVLSCPQKRHRPTAGLPSASWRSTWCWVWG